MITRLFLTTGILLAALPAAAQSPPLQLQQLDADGDGTVSRREFEIARAADFRRLDRDRDGALTEAEFLGDQEAGPARNRRAERYAEIDADGDGLVREDEYFAFGRRQFTAFDANGDGRVTPAEFRAASESAGDRSQDGGRDMFAALDRDGDGYIAVAELEESRALAFSQLDANEDGVLTVDEFTRSGRADAPERFRTLDANGDNRVTEAEYRALARVIVQRADTDGDGRVSRQEFEGAE